ncbi:MAG: hypothetical protein GC182_09090 [Rhodopseudomonas sp.]|nr:hypothetical protein [Rhodopseudomonas sp.]
MTNSNRPDQDDAAHQAARDRASATAVSADRLMAWDELGLLTPDERKSYWAKWSDRKVEPHPPGTIQFDFTEDRHDRLFADTAENIKYGE